MRNRRVTIDVKDFELALTAMRQFKQNLPRQFWGSRHRFDLATNRIDAVRRHYALMIEEGGEIIELAREVHAPHQETRRPMRLRWDRDE